MCVCTLDSRWVGHDLHQKSLDFHGLDENRERIVGRLICFWDNSINQSQSKLIKVNQSQSKEFNTRLIVEHVGKVGVRIELSFEMNSFVCGRCLVFDHIERRFLERHDLKVAEQILHIDLLGPRILRVLVDFEKMFQPQQNPVLRPRFERQDVNVGRKFLPQSREVRIEVDVALFWVGDE